MKDLLPPDRPSGRRRELSREEIDLWLSVTHKIVPRLRRAELAPDPAAGRADAATRTGPGPPGPGPLSVSLPRARPPAPAPLLAGIERKVRQRLTRGKIDVDAAIDLHGLRQDQAHRALRRFVADAQDGGARVVLVITGKGRRGEAGLRDSGVLRAHVPDWLTAADLRSMVIGFEEAGPPHGGSGALYVRIRRGPARR